MGRAIPIKLNGDRALLFGPSNVRLATTALQSYLPKGSDKLKMADAAFLVLQNDLDAILIFTQAGLQHTDQNLEMKTLERWLDKELTAGRKIGEFSKPILEGLKAANLIDIVYEPMKDESSTSAAGDHDGETERPTRGISGISEVDRDSER